MLYTLLSGNLITVSFDILKGNFGRYSQNSKIGRYSPYKEVINFP